MKNAVRVNIEADSLNSIVLGLDVAPGSPDLDHFTQEVFKEMTIKAGQKCTAIRRVLVPEDREPAVIDALVQKLRTIRVGDPNVEGVDMGPLVDHTALESARRGIDELSRETEIVIGRSATGSVRGQRHGARILHGAYPVARHERRGSRGWFTRSKSSGRWRPSWRTETSSRLSVWSGAEAAAWWLPFTVEDEDFIRKMTFGLAPYHGRLMVMNAKAAAESTGHGVVMPHLVHGGPGRAGGGEELGGLRSIHRYMQRIALQGDPERLERLCSPATVE